ncbi:hypothetical protein A2U01_0075163, partial [Trifolium medium]|nr:hypothetical protein [Trifolium medium]
SLVGQELSFVVAVVCF